jgi:peptidoglycan hydrolase-like protein with peptidoglycan-binding domain
MAKAPEPDDVVDSSPRAKRKRRLAFGVGDGDEMRDPQRSCDEPWDDFDPEAAQETDDQPVHFGLGKIVLEDCSSFERWLQSALKALVSRRLAVNGKIGPRTRIAIRVFQMRVKEFVSDGPVLTVHGMADKQTIAALEAATGSVAPSNSEEESDVSTHEDPESIDVPVAPARRTAIMARVVDVSDLVVEQRDSADGIEYVIHAGGDAVSFSYWTPDRTDYKPFNVSRYKGAKRGLLTDAQILAAGYSTSELGILRANALEESGGAFGAINTWDNQIVSWGMAQFAGHAGTLAALLAELKDAPGSANAYFRWFVRNGIDVAYGTYPYKDGTHKGWHVVVHDRASESSYRGDDGWKHIRTQPRLIGAFLLAGNDPAIQLGQVMFWRRAFLVRAIDKIIGKREGNRPGAAVRQFFTAERTLALIVRLHNWMPGNVVKWCDRFLAELSTENPGKDVYNPDAWDNALETGMAEKIAAERKRVKKGSYDTYALDLSRTRGSFVAGKT